MTLHMLEVDGYTWDEAADSPNGADKVSMDWAAGSEFLGLLGLMESTQIATSYNDGSGGDAVERAEFFDNRISTYCKKATNSDLERNFFIA